MRATLCLAMLVCTLAGCGDSTLTRREARLAYAAYTDRFDDTQPTRLRGTMKNPCRDGGHFAVVRVGMHDGQLVTDGNFERCTHQQISMDGELRSRSRLPGLQHFGRTPGQVTLREEGTFAVHGAVEGVCSVDMTTVHYPATRQILSREGSFCGYAVRELVEP